MPPPPAHFYRPPVPHAPAPVPITAHAQPPPAATPHDDGGLFSIDQLGVLPDVPDLPQQLGCNYEIQLESGDSAEGVMAYEDMQQILPSHSEEIVPAVSRRLRRSTRRSKKGKGKEVAKEEPQDEEIGQSSEYVF